MKSVLTRLHYLKNVAFIFSACFIHLYRLKASSPNVLHKGTKYIQHNKSVQIVLVTVSVDALQLCVVNKSAWSREQTAPYAFELLTDVKHWSICAESLLVEHLVLQAYCLTDIDEINPLGVELLWKCGIMYPYKQVSGSVLSPAVLKC